MKDSAGDPEFRVWLVADSQPERWHELLDTPLDPRHPARHSIWTSVLDYVQEALYRSHRLRFDTSRLYIRNAVARASDKPDAAILQWTPASVKEVEDFQALKRRYDPRVIITFGAFAFEFLRRASEDGPIYPYAYWGTKRLGSEFRKRIDSIDLSSTAILPLLHASIARGKFLESHRYFVGEDEAKAANYFEHVGLKLADLFLNRLREERIWIE